MRTKYFTVEKKEHVAKQIAEIVKQNMYIFYTKLYVYIITENVGSNQIPRYRYE